jgi:hypothetical protein
MHYMVSGRAPSIISAALALLLAAGMHLSAANHRTDAAQIQTASSVDSHAHG